MAGVLGEVMLVSEAERLARAELAAAKGAEPPARPVEERTTLVNPKQFERILKRRQARAKLDTLRKVAGGVRRRLRLSVGESQRHHRTW